MDILRFITAGNVDDGKSTLIGRLLYETGNIKADIMESVTGKTNDGINLAHITDGLRSERELGITIDVAYKYFTTPHRKYIISDAPGHFQYTKNLVTGASGVDAIIILIDARNGITEQTRRHSLVASFLNLNQVVIAINKMDAIDCDEQVFSSIQDEYKSIATKLNLQNISFIPISALVGDNVTTPSPCMTWYGGKTLMQYLEDCKPTARNKTITRFAVQCTINSSYTEFKRGYAGQLLSGTLKVGDSVHIYPGLVSATIRQILRGTAQCNEVSAGDNISLYLEGDIAAQRGDLICKANETSPEYKKNFKVTICWLDTDKPLILNEDYLIRINTFETLCCVKEIIYKIDVSSFEAYSDSEPIDVNKFAKIKIETKDKIAYDPFLFSPDTGRGILINLDTNYTSAAFIITE